MGTIIETTTNKKTYCRTKEFKLFSREGKDPSFVLTREKITSVDGIEIDREEIKINGKMEDLSAKEKAVVIPLIECFDCIGGRYDA